MKKLVAAIPSKVRITKDVSYEVLWVEDFTDGKTYGECRPDTKQIVIKKNESDTETLKTFIHECIHSLSFENKDLVLTEKQVRALEESLFKALKLNGLLDVLKGVL